MEQKTEKNPFISKVIEWSLANRYLVIILFSGLILAGIWAVRNTGVDAIPDLSDVQVIIFTEYPGQSPQTVEDQVTYQITTKLLSAPYATYVRGYSGVGMSMVYVLFEDGTDIYWARSRVLEYLSQLQGALPEGVTPQLGPDATGLGWVYQYVLESDRHSLQELRSIQDWFLKFELSSIEGVAEVASLGGFVKEYQINLDPVKLASYKLSSEMIAMKVKDNNLDGGGGSVEIAESEYIIRGLGYLKSVRDIQNIAIMNNPATGSPIYLKDVATVSVGPELRRGIAEWNGEGETVGGIIVMRFGENALKVIEKVKARLDEIKSSLPEGVQIKTAYDRSDLINRSIDNLQSKLIEESLIVAFVIIAFLLHVRSSLVAIITLPSAVLISFLIMKMQGINANIMSLGGIAIAIGAMVDASIVMVENAHTHLFQQQQLPESERKPRISVILDSAKEVGPSIFYSLLVITVSFMPVFTLEQQEGRMFTPLAFTKTYAMAGAAILAVTIVPILINYFVRGKLRAEEDHPVTRFLMKIYTPVIYFVVKYPYPIVGAAILIVIITIYPYSKLGSEFMPPLYEGDLLYMPTTLPGISANKVSELLQQTDKIIKSFPEVESVLGKAGRAETATDPAPLSMLETTIRLKPQDQWREGMTPDKLIEELDRAVQFPGLTNSWTMPIRTRIDMLSTGIKTPVGVKIAGPDLYVLQNIGAEIESALKEVKGTRSAFAERESGANFINFKINRVEIARHGLSVKNVQEALAAALGGMRVTSTVEGLERYPVVIRYKRDYRDNLESLNKILVGTPSGAVIPISQLAEIEVESGPSMIKTENGRPNVWVYVDIKDIDIGSYISAAQQAVKNNVKVPGGYSITWSGQFEYIERANEKLAVIIPLTVLIVLLLLYLNTKSLSKTLVIVASLSFSVVGAIWYLYFADYNMSVAVWVGIIALLGVDAETSVVMLLYLDISYDKLKKSQKEITIEGLKNAVFEGAVKRIRPKMMTVMTTFFGLFPILIGTGAGSDVMKRIAAPMAGGVFTSLLLELIVFPAIYFVLKKREIKNNHSSNKLI
ncbi:MAG: efflux RND transporter permease subunit [Ignavibacteriaceae bacterium]|nr:efflux RND transporter permease subunit [Ignavibacteriaceae bacterium]